MDEAEFATIAQPAQNFVDRTLFIPPLPSPNHRAIEVIRGAHISPLPMRSPLNQRIEAGVVIKLGDNVTTDDIIPSGSNILKRVANIPEFAEFTFCYLDPDFVRRAKAMGRSIIVGGENYGQGSSREHAAMLPMHLGVEAVVSLSFARIHRENLVNYGILPLVFKEKDDYLAIRAGDRITIEQVWEQVARFEVLLTVEPGGRVIETRLDVSDEDLDILKAGGALNHLKNKLQAGL